MVERYGNRQYNSNTTPYPKGIGDRYYGQDWARDFWFTLDRIGHSLVDAFRDTEKILVSIDGDIEIGSSYTEIDIPICIGYVPFSVTVLDEDEDWELPPASKSTDVTTRVETTAQTDFDISDATLDGSTTNYLKLAYTEADGESRTQEFGSSSWVYSIEPSFTITADSTAPTDYEILLATFVGDGSSSLTITQEDPTLPKAVSDPTSDNELTRKSYVDDNISTLTSDITYLNASTYVVDSDDALEAWANNTSGNDYTSVLIKTGTWTSANPVNLTTTGTKVVVGETGSVLSFTSSYAIRYTTLPDDPEYWMDNVTISLSDDSNVIYGFMFCNNMRNCKATVANSATSSVTAYGFYECKNIKDSSSIVTGDTSNNAGFMDCENCINCIGTSTSDSESASGFSNSTNLINCEGTGTCTDDGLSYGFYSCKRVRGCDGIGTSVNDNGYGFYICRTTSNCYCSTDSTTDNFHTTYASVAATAAYAAADTAEGGFNDV